jgi:hypothetical protein
MSPLPVHQRVQIQTLGAGVGHMCHGIVESGFPSGVNGGGIGTETYIETRRMPAEIPYRITAYSEKFRRETFITSTCLSDSLSVDWKFRGISIDYILRGCSMKYCSHGKQCHINLKKFHNLLRF